MQPTLFDDDRLEAEPTDPTTIARRTDPETSHAGARAIAYRSGTQKAVLLELYREAGADGLTDEEAARLAGMERHAATKRIADLKNDGALELAGERPGRTGLRQRVCRVADAYA